MRMVKRRFAAQKLPHQRIGTRKLAIIHHAHVAQARGQFANAAGEKFAAHHGVDAL